MRTFNPGFMGSWQAGVLEGLGEVLTPELEMAADRLIFPGKTLAFLAAANRILIGNESHLQLATRAGEIVPDVKGFMHYGVIRNNEALDYKDKWLRALWLGVQPSCKHVALHMNTAVGLDYALNLVKPVIGEIVNEERKQNIRGGILLGGQVLPSGYIPIPSEINFAELSPSMFMLFD